MELIARQNVGAALDHRRDVAVDVGIGGTGPRGLVAADQPQATGVGIGQQDERLERPQGAAEARDAGEDQPRSGCGRADSSSVVRRSAR